jgi:2-polyprenyl-6-methoxyphenol hydroxylase-like FAD-dependent oxidoreductase
MNYRLSDQTDVLIVGGGPAGLATAITLARAGVRVLLAERRSELSSMPRATSVSLRSMELLRAWGLEDEIRAGGNEVEWLGWQCDTLAAVASGYAWTAGYPTREQAAIASPTRPACVPQDHLEPVLLRHLRSLASARIELGTEVTDIEVGAGAAEAELRGADGVTRRVRADYLVAADGAHSRTRARLGIAMPALESLESAVTALFRAPLWERLGEHRYGIYSVSHPDAPGNFLPAGRGDRWLYGQFLYPESAPAEELLADGLVPQIHTASGFADLAPAVDRVGTFTLAAGLAERFRRERAFLVGDAAHRVTPRGGTGMNMAIQDGFDLGWKLSWVLRGWAAPALLDSYESERGAVARHNVARSTDPEGSLREPAAELHVDLGGRIPHLLTGGPHGRASTVDLVTPGLTLFAGPDGEWDRAEATGPGVPPVAVRRLDAIAARGLGLPGGGALLVRPDGAPAAWLTGAGDRDGALRAAIVAAGSPQGPPTGSGLPSSPPPSGSPMVRRIVGRMSTERARRSESFEPTPAP